MNLIYILVFSVLIYLINNLIDKNNLLQSLSGEKHQLFTTTKNIPLTGGLFMILAFFIINKLNFNVYYIFFISIFFIGFFSDLKIITSARLRFILQIISIFIFVLYYDFHIKNIRIIFIDLFLENKIFSYFFIIFCILIIVNGTNFIDGLNGLVLGYFLVVLLTIYNLNLFEDLDISNVQVQYILVFLLYLFLLNLLNKLYIGDSGSYFLGFIFGALLILIYKNNLNISPFFIVLLLWYPCFENLFSIIRKLRFNLSPLISDNKHFHQLLFYFLKKKMGPTKLIANNTASLLIIFFNLIILSVGATNIFNSQFQIMLIVISIMLYIFIYLRLFDYRFTKKTK